MTETRVTDGALTTGQLLGALRERFTSILSVGSPRMLTI